jgi:hypothetical protein
MSETTSRPSAAESDAAAGIVCRVAGTSDHESGSDTLSRTRQLTPWINSRGQATTNDPGVYWLAGRSVGAVSAGLSARPWRVCGDANAESPVRTGGGRLVR